MKTINKTLLLLKRKTHLTGSLAYMMVLLLLVGTFLSGCDEDEASPIDGTNDGTDEEVILEGDVSELFEEKSADKQTFTFDAGEFKYVVGAKGGTISINPNSLVDQDGNLVTGEVELEFVEIYSKKDMILSNKQTTSDGKLLISGGEIFVNIKQDGEQLKLKEGKSISYSIPTDSLDQEMVLFVGDTTDADSLNWEQVPDSRVGADGSQNQEDQFAFYFELDQFGWINCDKFYNDPREKTEVKVTVPEGYGSENTAAFMILKNELSVMGLYWNNDKEAFTGYNLPIGLEVYVLVISKIEDQYQYQLKEVTITENAVIEMVPEDVSLEALDSALDIL